MNPSTRRMLLAGGLVLLLLVLWLSYPMVFNVKGVFLWSDRLIFVLVACVIMLVSYIRGKPHLLAPWREVMRRRLAIISLLFIIVYVCVGLLDSIHYREPLPDTTHSGTVNYASDALSVLDAILAPLRNHTEETYSAPFATHSYSKKMLANAEGKLVRDYPRLKYGGAHLESVSNRGADIRNIVLHGFVIALLAWFGLLILLALVMALRRRHSIVAGWRALWNDNGALPWRTLVVTVLVMLLVLIPVGMLSVRYHVLGTDKVGIDVFYESIKSIRTGLVIGTLTTLIMLPFAIMLGIMAGYYRGWVDDAIQYLYTLLNSIPGVLLIAAAILSVDLFIAKHSQAIDTIYQRSDYRLLALCAVLGLTNWTSLCRLLRGETLKLRELDYIQAATAFGVRNLKIIVRHILPNVMHIVLIVLVLDFSSLVLAESVLSYIGVGVDPSTYSWGNMINNARMELAREPMVWWTLVAAFIMMSVLVLAANLFSDAVRDAFDPRLKQLMQKAGA